MPKTRCPWVGDDSLMKEYHDNEWGNPVHEDEEWFEFLVLDTFQAGLSWKTILHKRENFRAAFDDFDYEKIAQYDDAKVESLLLDAGIIRNRLKVLATISNAQAFVKLQKVEGSFNSFIWDFVGGKPIVNGWTSVADVPATTTLSDQLSKTLKSRGFKFVGSTICYAFMQAAGLVNDHLVSCFRHPQNR
ncbi:MAG TPA: DNA-3-methyladenine glycosylase I [Marinilabiliaceae bacterium]|nr:DNA-3-methyladenine glycosylase I [Marinilabiliaceae bacterium]